MSFLIKIVRILPRVTRAWRQQILLLGKEQESRPIPDREALDFLLSKLAAN
ncbi:MAG: hypothetical protein KKG00_12975 [Bacteroidetes bacterium]|nr:hypothetical protein [Bacteroidota bacterium]